MLLLITYTTSLVAWDEQGARCCCFDPSTVFDKSATRLTQIFVRNLHINFYFQCWSHSQHILPTAWTCLFCYWT